MNKSESQLENITPLSHKSYHIKLIGIFENFSRNIYEGKQHTFKKQKKYQYKKDNRRKRIQFIWNIKDVLLDDFGGKRENRNGKNYSKVNDNKSAVFCRV